MKWIQFEMGSWSSQGGELSMKYVRQMEYFAINRFHTLSANEVYVEVHAEHFFNSFVFKNKVYALSMYFEDTFKRM